MHIKSSYRLVVNNYSGQSLLEVIVAMAIFSLISLVIVTMITGNFNSLVQGGEQTVAEGLAQEGIEAVRSIRDGAWNELIYNTSAVEIGANEWQLSGEGTDETIGQYTRIIILDNVCRDSNDDIVNCPGDYTDVHTKQITSSVSWETRDGITNTVQQVAYLTDWDSEYWPQTDWSGGFGQSVWSDITRYDSGNKIEDSVVGQVTLGQTLSGTGIYNWPFTTPANYTYDNTKIEVTSGVAKLTGSAGGSGATINGGFEDTPALTGWNFYTWDVDGGEVTPTGTLQVSGGNPDQYVNVNVPSGNNDEVGGYWQQSFTTTATNPVVTIDLDYKVIVFGGTPNIAELRVYLDTVAGDPVTQVGSSIVLSGTTNWTATATIDASSLAAVAGTYYLKVALWVETPGGGGAGPVTVGLDNVDLSWQASGYPSDSPTIRNTASFTSANIYIWQGFIETATKVGGAQIYYQLSDDDGSTWYYWNGAFWASAGATDYNTAVEVNNYIQYFDASNQKLMFKAFFVSDGTQFISLDDLEVSYEVMPFDYYGQQHLFDDYSGIGAMSNSIKKTSLRFTAGSSKAVTAVRVYLNDEKGTSPTYRYGLQSDSGGQPSGVWLGSTNTGYGDYQATAVGWQTINLNESVSLTSGTAYHLVIQYQSGTANGANNIDLRQSSPNNFRLPYNASDNPDSNTLWSEDGGTTWSILGNQPIYVLDFSDLTHEGNPYQDVVSHQVYGTNYFGMQITPGDNYQLSTIGFYVSENNQGPQDDIYVNVYDVTNSLNISGGSVATPTQTTNNGYVWTEFTFSLPITLVSGSTYRIYLSSPGSDSTGYYIVKSVYNDNTAVLNNLNFAGTTGFTINSSNSGSAWNSNINYDIVGMRFAKTIYETSGYLISSAFDAGSPVAFTIIEWDQISPSCSPSCDVKLQIQTAPDNGGSPGAWSATWCGPDGEDGDETDYYTVNTGELISLDHNGDQWIRYKAILSSDSTNTPTLLGTRVYYQ